MKRRFLSVVALLLAMTLALAGCGKPQQKQPGLPDLRALLAQNYQIEDIFYRAGLPVKATQAVKDEAGLLYFPVDHERYTTMDSLNKLVESCYTEAVAQALLATQSEDGGLLYKDIDGKLCRSASPVITPVEGELDSDTLKVTKAGVDGKSSVAWFTIQGSVEGGEAFQLEWQVMDTKSGWRLAQTRQYATRTGAGGEEVPAQSGGETTTPDTTPHSVAQAFLDALVAGDGQAVGELATDRGSYEEAYLYPDFQGYGDTTGWGVTAAEIVETQNEQESVGEYTVRLTVSGGDGTLQSGNYYLDVGASERKLVVRAFRPVEQTPYESLMPEQRSLVAVNQVLDMLTLNGPVVFATPSELNSGILTEYALYHLTKNDPGDVVADVPSYTKEEVQATVLKLFGIEGLTLDDQFYSSDAQGYLFLGRGGITSNFQIEQLQDGNGIALVEVRLYNDPLQFYCTGKVLYTLSNNWNDSYEFVSAQRQDV